MSAIVRISKMAADPKADRLLNETGRWADSIHNIIAEREPDALRLTFVGEEPERIDYADATQAVEDVLRGIEPLGWSEYVRIDEPT